MILNPFSTPSNSGNGPEFVKFDYLIRNNTIDLQLTPKPILVSAFIKGNNNSTLIKSGTIYCEPDSNYPSCFLTIVSNVYGNALDILSIKYYSNGNLNLKATDTYDIYYMIYYAP